MSAIDDLNAAIAALGGVVNDAVAAIEKELEIIANAPQDDTAAVTAATDAIKNITTTLAAEVAKVNPPAPPVEQPPVEEPAPVEPAPVEETPVAPEGEAPSV